MVKTMPLLNKSITKKIKNCIVSLFSLWQFFIFFPDSEIYFGVKISYHDDMRGPLITMITECSVHILKIISAYIKIPCMGDLSSKFNQL